MDRSPPPRRIAHLDVDAFLASVEQAVHPELAGRPVVVGGSPRSRNLVMSCSYEARRFGVRPGMLLAVAARRCPRAIFRDGDSQAANRLRDATTRILLEVTPRVEVASIDDFFLDLTGTERLHGPALEVVSAVRRRVHEELALPLTIGLGGSRTLARLAGKVAKPGGVAEIFPGHEEAFLAGLPVDALPGVGHAIGRRLQQFSIRTAGDLRRVSREVLFAAFGRDGLVIHDRARGIDETPVEATHALDADGTLVARPPRSIQRISTFEPEEGRRDRIEAMLGYLVERASFRLRRHGARARAVETRIAYVDTRTRTEREEGGGGEGLSFSRRRRLSAPSDSTEELRALALAILRGLPRRRALVKRVGVALHDLAARDGWSGWQTRLFDEDGAGAAERDSRADRHRRLDEAVDRLRERMGFGRIVSGTSLTLADDHPLGPDGLRLRTPSLNQ